MSLPLPVAYDHTRTQIRRSIRSLDHSMKSDPAMFATPHRIIIPK